MTSRRRNITAFVGLCVLVAACTATIAAAAAPAEPKDLTKKHAVVWAAGDIKWTDNPRIMPGAKVAALWGDPARGAYGALKSLPAGSMIKLHTHSHDQKNVTITGTIRFTIEGETAKDLGPGSFIFIPAGAKHSAECVAGADCVYFEEYPAAADIKYVGESGAK